MVVVAALLNPTLAGGALTGVSSSGSREAEGMLRPPPFTALNAALKSLETRLGALDLDGADAAAAVTMAVRGATRGEDAWTTWAEARGLGAWLREARDEATVRIPLLSKLMTNPLTVAYQAETHEALGELRRLGAASGATTAAEATPIRIHVVGARAEATLPWRYWSELSAATSAPAWRLLFVGPEIPPAMRAAEYVARGVSGSFLVGKYEEAPSSSVLPPPDLFVLFNPGLASVTKEWEPAWERVVRARRPILATAFNEEDWSKELEFARSRASAAGFVLDEGGRNPFASRWPTRHSSVNGDVVTNAFWWLMVPAP